MIVIKVELWPKGLESRKVELSRFWIANVGGTNTLGDYKVAINRKGQTNPPWQIGFGGNETSKPIREGVVKGHPRLREHVLVLVRKALESVKF